jgi:hypothetical protein
VTNTGARSAARAQTIAPRAVQATVFGAAGVVVAMVIAESPVVQALDAELTAGAHVDRPYWMGLLTLVAGWVWVTLGIVGIGVLAHLALRRSWWQAAGMVALVVSGVIAVRMLDREFGGGRGWNRDPLGRGASWFSPSPSAFLVAFAATSVFVMSDLEDVRRHEIAYGGVAVVAVVGLLDVVRGQRYWADVLTGGAFGVLWAAGWILLVAGTATFVRRGGSGLART